LQRNNRNTHRVKEEIKQKSCFRRNETAQINEKAQVRCSLLLWDSFVYTKRGMATYLRIYKGSLIQQGIESISNPRR
jgi:hypothetical protein